MKRLGIKRPTYTFDSLAREIAIALLVIGIIAFAVTLSR